MTFYLLLLLILTSVLLDLMEKSQKNYLMNILRAQIKSHI